MVLYGMAKRNFLDVMRKIAYIGDGKHTFRVVKTLFLRKTNVLVTLVAYLRYLYSNRAKLYDCTNMRINFHIG